jgi:hypothetical protein
MVVYKGTLLTTSDLFWRRFFKTHNISAFDTFPTTTTLSMDKQMGKKNYKCIRPVPSPFSWLSIEVPSTI